MIYTILSLFAFYELSAGSRLLLQSPAVPEYVPIQPQTPATPATPVTPVTPATPATPATPVDPAVPVQPHSPVTLPPFVVLPPLSAIAPEKLECSSPYTSPGSCAGQIKTVTNPIETFKMNCNALGACAQSQVTFEFLPGSFAERIEGLWFSEAYAGYGATITIRNLQGGNAVLLDKIECQGATSCQDLTLILEGATLNEFDCAYPSFCPGCTVKFGAHDPHPTPCYGW